jgi:hypothetical protein
MLYVAKTRTLIETVAPGLIRSDGSRLSDAGLAELARLQGRKLQEGPVDQVQVVFMIEDEAQSMLSLFKRYGLECRAFVEGQEQVIHPGGRVQQMEGEPQGPLVPVLREASWPHLATAVHRRLLAGPLNEGPWVTFGWDAPTTIFRFSPQRLGTRSIEDVEAEAVGNLVKLGLEPKEFAPGAVGLPGEYASEGILSHELMKKCARVLSCELLVVAVPKQGRLIAVSANDLAQVERVIANTRQMFDAATDRRVSPLPFLVGDGKVIGFASAGQEAPRTRKPWYQFW